MNRPPRRTTIARFLLAVIALAAITVGIPAVLVTVARILYGNPNPLTGLTAPGHWTAHGARRLLTRAVAEDQLIASLCRVLLTAAWALLAVLVVTLVSECWYQARHRHPAPHVTGIGWSQAIARQIAAGLLVIATLAPARTAHARPLAPRAVATQVVGQPTPPQAAAFASASRLAHVGPQAAPADVDQQWTRHLVRPGDSVYSIAERLTSESSVSSAQSVREVAQLILDRNLGTTMTDGQRFTTAGYIEVGWQLDVPATSHQTRASINGGRNVVTVQPRDNLWNLLDAAGNHHPTTKDVDAVARANDGATTADGTAVFHATRPNLIHPGEQLDLTAGLHPTEADDAPSAPASADTTDGMAAVPPTLAARADPLTEPTSSTPTNPTTATTTEPPGQQTFSASQDATTLAPTTATPTSPPLAPAGQQTSPPDRPASDRSSVPTGALAFGITGVVIAAGTANELRRRRQHRHANRAPHTQPPPLTERQRQTAADVHALDASDPQHLARELTYLYKHLDPDSRELAVVQAAQLTGDGTIEVVFTGAIDAVAGWEQVAGRAWRLTTSHHPDELASITVWPPTVPCLVSLGDYDNHIHTLINLEVARHGINLTGNIAMQHALATSIVWELTTGPLAERADIVLVDLDLPGTTQLPRIAHLDATAALDRLGSMHPANNRASANLAAERVGEHADAHEPTIVITTNTHNVERWTAIASTTGLVVIAIDGQLADALEIHLDDGQLIVPTWSLTCAAQQLTAQAARNLDELLATGDAEPVADRTVPPTTRPDEGNDKPPAEQRGPHPPSANGDHPTVHHDEEERATDDASFGSDYFTVDEDPWELPEWPVMVHLLGDVHVTVDGEPVKLTGQQLSALAFLAINHDVARVELLEAISKDRQAGQDRVRDILYALRRALGNDAITTDGDRIRTGATLGTDLDQFELLTERARQHPHETADRLAQNLDLATGRPFTYPTRASDHWRWVTTDYLTGIWEGHIADAALELARHYLNDGNAVDAHATARRGLQASPLSNPLTSIMVEALLTLGEVGPAKRVVQDWERTLTNHHLEPDTDTPRTILERHASPTGHAAGS